MDVQVKEIKKKAKKELNKITDTVDLDMVNKQLNNAKITKLDITKKTLMNIGQWALDGKSEFEIRQNLELTISEWNYLLKVCPAIVVVMQHSLAYADIVVAGSLYQTAVGGHTIHRKVPMKVGIYEDGRKVGERIEYAEYIPTFIGTFL